MATVVARRIPSLYLHDPAALDTTVGVVQSGSWWVVNGQGKATKKYEGVGLAYVSRNYDGHPVLTMTPIADLPPHWFVRTQLPSKTLLPKAFHVTDFNANTGAYYGWMPIEQTGYGDLLAEVVADMTKAGNDDLLVHGTFELFGPGIKDNPHAVDAPTLLRHDRADVLDDVPVGFPDLMHWLAKRPDLPGVVWHHPDGYRFSQVKRADAVRWMERFHG